MATDRREQWSVFWSGTSRRTHLAGIFGARARGRPRITGFLLLEFVAGGSTFVAVDAVWNVLNSFTLSAIPMFIILGEIIVRSGVSERIYNSLSPLFQRVPGGLLQYEYRRLHAFRRSQRIKLVDCRRRRIRCPIRKMTERGYDRKTVLASLAGGGTLGLLIPPSLSLLIFALNGNINRAACS